jgi:nicotinamidase-related amidase
MTSLPRPDPRRDRWIRPHPEAAALLVVDVQRDFTLPGAPGCIPGTAEAVPAIVRLVEEFRSRSRPVVHVVRLYLPDGSNADLCRRTAVAAGWKVAVPGSDGAEPVDELKPSPAVRLDADRLLAGELQAVGPAEWFCFKPRFGAFHATPLARHLEVLGVDTVVVCGANFPNCPRATVLGAVERDLRVVVAADATSGLGSPDAGWLQSIGVAVLSTAEWVEAARSAGTVAAVAASAGSGGGTSRP